MREPPPDLAVEIDNSRPDVAREPIYAALGVREFWRYDGERLESLHRSAKGESMSSPTSLAFPTLAMTDVARFLEQGLRESQSAAIRALVEWLRSR